MAFIHQAPLKGDSLELRGVDPAEFTERKPVSIVHGDRLERLFESCPERVVYSIGHRNSSLENSQCVFVFHHRWSYRDITDFYCYAHYQSDRRT